MKKYSAAICLLLSALCLTSCRLFEDKLHALDRRVHERYEAQDYAGATAAAEEALKETEKRFLKDRPEELIIPLNNLAGLYRLSGRLKDAAGIYVRMLEVYETRGAAEADQAMTSHDLAAVSLDLGDFASAERYEKQALKHKEQYVMSEGLQEIELAPTLNNLGYVYLAQKKNSEAEPLLLHAARIIESGLGPSDPNLEITCLHLAELYRREKRYAEAEKYQKKMLESRIAREGGASPQVAQGWNNLGVIYKDAARLDESEAAFGKALEFFKSDPVKYASDLEIVRQNYAEVLALNGKKSESDSLLGK